MGVPCPEVGKFFWVFHVPGWEVLGVPCPKGGKFWVFCIPKVESSIGSSLSPGWEVLGVVHPQGGKFSWVFWVFCVPRVRSCGCSMPPRWGFPGIPCPQGGEFFCLCSVSPGWEGRPSAGLGRYIHFSSDTKALKYTVTF